MANEMLWTTQSGYLTNNKLNLDFQRAAQPLLKFRQFTMFKEAFGKHKGQSVNWLKVANIGTYGGSLTETNTMHESTLALSWGTLTVDEYGNSIPFSFKVSALSEFDVRDLIRQGLLDDAVKCIDGVIEREFNKTPLRAVGSAAATIAITTDSTATATNTSALNSYHTRRMVLELKKRNVPGYAKLGGDYVFVCSHEAMESMQGSIESTIQYTTQGYEKILNGEVGRWSGVRFVEDGFASRFTYSASGRSATAKSWGGGYSLDAYLFGSPTVREAVVVPEEIRLKVVTDYGRSHGLAWYFLAGYSIEWSDADNARIIKWDSAA